MRNVLVTVGGCGLALVLAAASVPWICWAIGRAALGDDDGAARAIAVSPLGRYFDWIEAP